MQFLTETMVDNVAIAVAVIGVAWAIAFAIWAMCKYK